MSDDIQKHTIRYIVIAVLLVTIAVSYLYFYNLNSLRQIDQADLFVADFYNKLDNEDYVKTLPLFHDSFFVYSNRDHTLNYLATVDDKLGKIKEKRLINYGVGTDKNNMNFVKLEYEMIRDHAYSKEVFTLYITGKNQFQILGYHVYSDKM